ncbi:MAG: TlpA disulfide reductase family protein [Pedobacter sp.]
MKKILVFTLTALLIAAAIFFLSNKKSIIESNNANKFKASQKPKQNHTNGFVRFTIDDPNILNGNFQTIRLYSLDSLAWGKNYDITSQSFKKSVNEPVILIQPNDTQTPFLVYPGDSIRIRYAKTDTMQMYIPGNAIRNNELNFFRQLVQRTGNLYYFFAPMAYQRRVQGLNQIHSLEYTIDSIKQNRIRFLDSYQKNYPLNDDFVKIAVNCIKSTAIDDSLLLYHNNKDLLKGLNLYVPFAKAKITSLEKIGFQPYPMFIQASKHALAMITGTNPHDGMQMNAKIFPGRFDYVTTTLTGNHRNFFLSQTINIASKNNINISNAYLEKFHKYCTNKNYVKLVDAVLADKMLKAKFKQGEDNLLSVNGRTVQDIGIVLQKYQGNLVLIDLWASWCAPCIQEIPFTEQLKEKYKSENIVFVTISTDSEISDWKKAANAEKLNGANDFLLLNSSSSTFMKQYRVQSIPRYMLLDKSGKMLNDDAPRPSNVKLTTLIDQYL